ncbi:PAS domain S-box protein [Devosia sp. MC532]|uniref:PAS domain S-box protein n=1 Tax=Devosia sp. MC532 TaxID=2799788 RepID=UPI0018F56894|nr:PAS domain S-box protein [Devosia sp. MC532]MBJ7579117.1 PAS domain S-box protein [Devosia sp. MC532]
MDSSKRLKSPMEARGLDHLGPSLASLLAATPLGLVVANEKGELAYFNPAFTQLLGYAEGALAEVTLEDTVHDADVAAARFHFNRLCRGEISTYRGEHRLRHADGSPIWVMVNASVLESEGVQRHVVIQFSNIELQKKAEDALIYTEKRWRFALQSARQGVWDYDYRTDSIFYSDAWRQIRGYEVDEWVDGATAAWHSRIHPDDLPAVKANIDRQAKSDDAFEGLEYRERRKDGSYVWILSRGRAIEWDEAGEPLRTIGTDTDITTLKNLQYELAAQKERLSVILNAMADGMISTDAKGYISFLNPAAQNLLGLGDEVVIGRKCADVFRVRSESSGAVLPNPVCNCLERSQLVRLEDDCLLWAHDGRVRDIRCIASPVNGAGHEVIGAVLVFQDMSESRSLQRQLAHSATHDMLTGIPNRAAFDRALAEVIGIAQAEAREHVLIYIDLDRFKPVNDTAGHAAGDSLLKLVAQTIRGACRQSDLAARIGGDEFALLLRDCPLTIGLNLAQKVVAQIAAIQFMWEGRAYSIGASAGVTTITAKPPHAVGFLGEADAACYAAKAAGRGCAVAFQNMRP